MRRVTAPLLAFLVGTGSIGLAEPPETAATAPAVPPARPIDRTKITELDPPPLPEQVVLPKPPEFRLAPSAEQLPISAEHFVLARRAIASGLRFLLSAQHESGGWMVGHEAAPTDDPDAPAPVAVAVTALSIKALAQADPGIMETRETDALRRALAFVRRAKGPDGSFEGGALSNYVTSIVVMAMSSLDRDQLADEINGGVRWLQIAQWDDGEGLDVRKDWHGGAGYGKHGRPDLSNTQMMLDALYDAGLSPDEPAFQRAMAFVSRAQNLRETNTADWAGDDGGFVYTPANGGESMASEAAGEGRYGQVLEARGAPRALRSYGSMTYAGFKSLFYAGLSADDVRVRAAFDWVRRNWTFDENPGLGQQGLYYYYHVLARSLAVAQQDIITDIDGVPHNWREELIDAIVKRQRDDGSWKNDADRWLEGEPVMATVDALLALQEALKAP
ncbi:MAG: prenyltransferase/squalene oxidase repeat-containing protein [Planctomycetota bacterium]|jgi:squalene-hopene/tetraprenyl-beta-curcumene cyclase